MNSNMLFKRKIENSDDREIPKRQNNNTDKEEAPTADKKEFPTAHKEEAPTADKKLTNIEESLEKKLSKDSFETLRVIADKAISATHSLVKPAQDALSDLMVQINRVDFFKQDPKTQLKLNLYYQDCQKLLTQGKQVGMNEHEFVIRSENDKQITIADVLYELEEMETLISSLRQRNCSDQEIMTASMNRTLNIKLARCVECAELALEYLTMYPINGKPSMKLPPIDFKVSVELVKFLEEDHAFVVLNRTVDSMDVTEWNDDVLIVDPYAENASYTLKEIRNASIEQRKNYSVFKQLMARVHDPLEVEYEYASFENLTIGCKDVNFENNNVVANNDVDQQKISFFKST